MRVRMKQGLAAVALAVLGGWTTSAGAQPPDAAAAAVERSDRLRARVEALLARQGHGQRVAAAAERRQRALDQRRRALSATPTAAARPGQAVGLVVKLRDADLQRRLEAGQAPPDDLVDAIAAAAGVPLRYLRPMSGGQAVLRFDTPLATAAALELPARVRQLGAVEQAELDLLMRPRKVSADPDFALQWNLLGPAQGFAGGIAATELWDVFVGDGGTVVAVVDTGVVPHPEFAGRLLPGYDFIASAPVGNDGNGRDADATDPGDWVAAGQCGAGEPAASSSWHGTHVAGIVGASGDNGMGMAGVNWRTRILPVRVLGRCGGTVSDIVDGIRWAAGLAVPGVPANPTPAQVINLSLGGYSPTGCQRSYRDAIAEARGQGSLVVVAAGNEADDFEQYVPANCEGVLTVVSVDPFGDLASYSNYSFTGQVSAPGGDINRYGTSGGIRSTLGAGAATLTGYTYGALQGTSMAAPHVAGIASLALGLNPQLVGEELRFIIELASTPFPADSTCQTVPVCGAGIADSLMTAGVAAVMADYQLVYEFYNEDLKHYFRTGAKSEAAGINRGAAGAGWFDTGDYFYGWSGPVDGAVPVCRFYGTPGKGPNSHFYTASAAECELVKKDPGWTYEGTGFYAKLPLADGTCPGDSVPVYRVYNNRWRQNDSNHRYTIDRAIYDQMVAAGWAAEGVMLCAFA